MNEMEAAIGIGNLEIYNEILEKRSKNLYLMMKKFKKFDKYFITFKENSGEKIGPHAFPVTLRENIGFDRNQLVDFLGKNQIDTRNLFSSMPTQCPGFAFLGYKLGFFPNAEYIGNNGLHIGVHQDLNEEHIDYIINTFDKFLIDFPLLPLIRGR